MHETQKILVRVVYMQINGQPIIVMSVVEIGKIIIKRSDTPFFIGKIFQLCSTHTRGGS